VFATLLIGVFILLTARDSKRWILPLFDRDRQPTEAPAPEEP
jgi:hypothetical protein